MNSPSEGGRRPLWGAAGLLVAAFAACANGSADQELQPVDLGMAATTDDGGADGGLSPYYSDGNLTLYQVNVPVRLPVRRPTGSELQSLGPAPAGTPYPRAPFLTVGDESIEVHYVISNLDDAQQTVFLLIDPWNEFVRWNPGVTVVSDDESDPNFGYDLGFLVDGRSRVEGDLTQDDMHEIAVKLAAAENVVSQEAVIAAQVMDSNEPDATTLLNHIFNPQNWSNTGDPLFTPWVPAVVAGLTGFDLGLRVIGAPADVAVEITIQVQDLNGNRLVAQGSTVAQMGIPPTTISPPAARF